MRVEWTNYANEQRDQITYYIYEQFGEKWAMEFLNDVDDAAELVFRHPSIGTIDPLFADRPLTHRSIIIGELSKMVYFVKGDIIYIAAIWDCRKEPKTQAEQVK